MTLRYLPVSNAESVQYYTGHSNERHSSKAVTSALRGLHSVRAQKSHHHPAQTKISRTAEGDIFTSKDDRNHPRAQPTIDTHALQGPAHAPGTSGASMLAGQPRFRIGGGWKHHQSSTRDEGATPSPCRPNLTSGRSWIWGRHRSHGLPAQDMVRCGGRAGTCDCWKEHSRLLEQGRSMCGERGSPGRCGWDEGREEGEKALEHALPSFRLLSLERVLVRHRDQNGAGAT